MCADHRCNEAVSATAALKMHGRHMHVIRGIQHKNLLQSDEDLSRSGVELDIWCCSTYLYACV